MKKELQKVLHSFVEDYRDNIQPGSRFYREVSIGSQAGKMGYRDIEKKYRNVYAVIPLKQALGGMKVRIDGRTFKDYAQFESGVAVPGYVARKIKLPYKSYVPEDSLILNF